MVLGQKISYFLFLGPDNAQAFARRVGKAIINRVPANAPFAMRLVQTVGKCLLTHNESVAKPIRDALGPLKTSILSQSLANLFAMVDETFDHEEKKAAIIVEKVRKFLINLSPRLLGWLGHISDPVPYARYTAVFWQKLEEIRNFKNESRHSTQLNKTSKTNSILYTDAIESHGRVVSVTGFTYRSRVRIPVRSFLIFMKIFTYAYF